MTQAQAASAVYLLWAILGVAGLAVVLLAWIAGTVSSNRRDRRWP